MALYDAFISYSHAKDKPIAARLQSTIQKLGKPWYRRRALRLFRDDTSLSATPHLWPMIEQTLGQSRYFLLLASPEAAASKWVNKEAIHWIEHNSIDTVLIALTHGELFWDEAGGDFAPRANHPLPLALAKRFPHEPKWVDLRPYREGANKRDAKFTDFAPTLPQRSTALPKKTCCPRKCASSASRSRWLGRPLPRSLSWWRSPRGNGARPIAPSGPHRPPSN
jgi:TIR domain